MPFHLEAFGVAVKAYNVCPTEREISLLEGIRTRDIIRAVCKAHGVLLSEDELSMAEQVKRTAYKKIFRPVPMDGARELVMLLIELDCRLAIVTGTSEASAISTLEVLDVAEHFDVIISHDLDIPAKPDPAPYSAAATQMSVSPSNCLAVENAPAGISSARSAGLPCLAVASYLNPQDLLGANKVFDNLNVLVTWLRENHQMDDTLAWRIT
jgi:beta-phosphoglucomutase